jgi:hypothetical protein
VPLPSAAKSALCEIRGEKQAVNLLGMREDRAGIAPQITQGGDQHLHTIASAVFSHLGPARRAS